MAMKLSIWKILTTDVRELNWGQSVEVTKSGAEAAKAVFDLAKALHEQAPNGTRVKRHRQPSSLPCLTRTYATVTSTGAATPRRVPKN